MKRKIFSKLLMVALVIAAVGSFVSCKDYDDDINNLQKQIDNAALKSDLAALQTTLTSVQSTASKAATDATSALSKAGANADDIAALKTKANELGTQIATAAQNATKGIEDAAKAAQAAKDAADAAKEAKDAIAPAIQAALEEATAKFNAAIGAKADTTTVNALAARLAEAETTLGTVAPLVAANATAIEGLETKAEDFETRIAALEAKTSGEGAAKAMEWAKAVTSVELFASITEGAPGENMELLFLTGKEVANKFGADVTPAGNVARSYGAADKGEIAPVTYEKDKEISFDNRIIVRVNPANATFTEDSVTLINSLGESLDEYIEVKKVEAYNQLITRADVATGLYIVTIARKAGVTDDQLAEATSGEKITAKEREGGKKVRKQGEAMFALGIKSGDAARIVYSTFDLGVSYGDYVPVETLGFQVKGDAEDEDWTPVAQLHNRWDGTKIVGEDLTKELPGLQKTGRWNGELVWQNLTDKDVKAADRYTVDTLTANKKANYKFDDARYDIKAYTGLDADSRSFKVRLNNPYIQYYYVTLDDYAAVESAPSEFQSWTKYGYTGLYTITPATDVLKVTIDDAASKGDIIGFRVFAVNYDGSLVDPDGRSFYVKVGEAGEAESLDIAASWTPRKANTEKDFDPQTGTDAQKAEVKAEGAVANDDFFGVVTGAQFAAANADEKAEFLDAALAAMIADAIKAKPLYNTGLSPLTFPEDANLDAVIVADDLSGYTQIAEVEGVIDYAKYFTGAKYAQWVEASAHPSVKKDTYMSERAENYLFWAFLDKDKKALTKTTALKNIKYIAVGFGNSQNWVDDATLEFADINVIDQDHHNQVVYKANFDITKDMPTVSSGFGWKYTLGPDASGNLDMYVQAATATDTYVAWKTQAPNAGSAKAVFNLKDHATIPNASDITLTIQDSKKTKVVDNVNPRNNQIITYKYATGNIAANQFKFDVPYTAKLVDGIAGISLDFNDDDELERGTYGTTITSLSTITFKNPVAAQSYSVSPYTYSVSATATGANTLTKTSTEYWLTWNDAVVTLHRYADGAAPDKTKPAVRNIPETAVTLPNLFSAKNAVNFVSKANDQLSFTSEKMSMDVYAQPNAEPYYFIAQTGNENVEKVFRAKLISGEGNEETEFYFVAIDAAGKLTFTKNSAITNEYAPAREHTATLKVWAVDYFGFGATWVNNKWVGNEDADPILEMPITIKVSE